MESKIFALTKEDNNKVNEIKNLLPDIIVGELNREKFSDGEICLDYKTSVRNNRVYIVGTLNNSDNIIAMNLAIDAAKRASASEIIPVIPYFPYARQDKKDQVRGPIGAKVMAKTFEVLGATNIIVFDLHADQIQGFFEIPITHMEGKHLFGNELVTYIKSVCNEDLSNIVLCSPDAGGTKRVKHFRDKLNHLLGANLPFVMIDKTRERANVVGEMLVVGDVKDKHVIVIDDMCDTGGTLCKGANKLKEDGALSVMAVVTHGIFSGDAKATIGRAEGLDRILTSDSLPQYPDKRFHSNWHMANIDRLGMEKIDVISNADQIVRAIMAINTGVSVEKLKVND